MLSTAERVVCPRNTRGETLLTDIPAEVIGCQPPSCQILVRTSLLTASAFETSLLERLAAVLTSISSGGGRTAANPKRLDPQFTTSISYSYDRMKPGRIEVGRALAHEMGMPSHLRSRCRQVALLAAGVPPRVGFGG